MPAARDGVFGYSASARMEPKWWELRESFSGFFDCTVHACLGRAAREAFLTPVLRPNLVQFLNLDGRRPLINQALIGPAYQRRRAAR